MIIESIQAEYRRYRELAEDAVAQIDDMELHKPVSEDGNSVAVILNHLSGNLRSRFTNFLTEDGEKSWRDRDNEFVDHREDREQIMHRWRESLKIVEKAITELNDGDLSRLVKIRGNQLKVVEALERSLAHYSYHVGQIVLLCRNFRGRHWRTLSIPRGESAAYNLNPDKERNPRS